MRRPRAAARLAVAAGAAASALASHRPSYAEVAEFRLEIIQWLGGTSIWAPGAVTTYDLN
ncbi:hypothetical protein GCM10010399_26170 [Dactylosporangium fulvum]|uniref:Uncharacterized protein n=1 Tax=Dactylosporangium fulvum TaxID=53359 RepID=A0ABY5WA24_9ACTN|nr:hypothetical protein [Dactylosporangium fulvum]UWP86905.1 hypothetical protein Dfulv_22740 [Dactylosporangium fulvum]